MDHVKKTFFHWNLLNSSTPALLTCDRKRRYMQIAVVMFRQRHLHFMKENFYCPCFMHAGILCQGWYLLTCKVPKYFVTVYFDNHFLFWFLLNFILEITRGCRVGSLSQRARLQLHSPAYEYNWNKLTF